jgi:putative flippase GtrA
MSADAPSRSQPRRAALFAGIGLINTTIDVSVFACLYRFEGLGVVPSNVLAFLLAAANSYLLNALVTFGDRAGTRVSPAGFARFLCVAVIAMGASTAIVWLLAMHMHPLLAKLIATAASTAIGYAGTCRFVFPHAGARGRRAPPSG